MFLFSIFYEIEYRRKIKNTSAAFRNYMNIILSAYRAAKHTHIYTKYVYNTDFPLDVNNISLKIFFLRKKFKLSVKQL